MRTQGRWLQPGARRGRGPYATRGKVWPPNVCMLDHREPCGEVQLDGASSRLERVVQWLREYSPPHPMHLQRLRGQKVVNEGPILILNSILFSRKLGKKELFIPQGRNVEFISIMQITKGKKIFPTERPKLLLN